MKNIRLKDLAILLFIISWCVFFMLFIKTTLDNQDLQTNIAAQNQLIKNITKNDSIHALNTKSYSDVIKKYTTSYSVKIGKKEYTFEQFVKLYDKVEQQNYMLKDSLTSALETIKALKNTTNKYGDLATQYNKLLHKESDSSFTYKELFNFAKKLYGFSVSSKKDSIGNLILTATNSKADSSMILYKYFKNRMKETSPGVYIIDLSGEPSAISIKDTKPNNRRGQSKN